MFSVYCSVPSLFRHAVTPSATVIGAPPERTTLSDPSVMFQEISEGYEPPSRVTTYSLPSQVVTQDPSSTVAFGS